MNWIPLSERFPDPDQEVILMNTKQHHAFKPFAYGKNIGSLVDSGRRYWITSTREYGINEFTHWCELPPYA